MTAQQQALLEFGGFVLVVLVVTAVAVSCVVLVHDLIQDATDARDARLARRDVRRDLDDYQDAFIPDARRPADHDPIDWRELRRRILAGCDAGDV